MFICSNIPIKPATELGAASSGNWGISPSGTFPSERCSRNWSKLRLSWNIRGRGRRFSLFLKILHHQIAYIITPINHDQLSSTSYAVLGLISLDFGIKSLILLIERPEIISNSKTFVSQIRINIRFSYPLENEKFETSKTIPSSKLRTVTRLSLARFSVRLILVTVYTDQRVDKITIPHRHLPKTSFPSSMPHKNPTYLQKLQNPSQSTNHFSKLKCSFNHIIYIIV